MATHSSVLALESQGRGSLVGRRLWGRTESNTTEVTWQIFFKFSFGGKKNPALVKYSHHEIYSER